MPHEATVINPPPALAGTDNPADISTSLIQMIERVAFSPEVDIDRMDKLLTFLGRVKAAASEAAFTRDFAAMQPGLPSIDAKGQIVHNKQLIAKYARWEDINDVIKPVLGEHNFVLSFRSAQDEKSVTITAILRHSDGHSETAELRLPIDTSGAKNAVQAIGSTVSYGKRYAAGLVLNLTSRAPTDADDDAKAAEADAKITEAQVLEINKLIAKAFGEDEERKLKFFGWLADKFGADRVGDIPAAGFDKVKHALLERGAK